VGRANNNYNTSIDVEDALVPVVNLMSFDKLSKFSAYLSKNTIKTRNL
jgi:hypothetical protein